MPKNKLQDVVFTLIMATIMVYGMIVYNVALNTGSVTGKTFVMALHEMPIMVPIAFVLEFFVVGKLARMLTFSVMTPDDRPAFITYGISICICCIMCPVMSLIATILFKMPIFRNVDQNMGAEFSDGYFVSDVLLWPAGAVYIPPYLPGKVNP